MRALTVQQPWAWAVFNGKPIENRTQAWSYRGPLAIHAGQRWSERGGASIQVSAAWLRNGGHGALHRHHERITFGAIIGVVDLVDVHPESGGCCYPWGEETSVARDGRRRTVIQHLVLENPRPLAEPIPCRGALGLWTPPADVLARLEDAR